jgi:hypothetical protein
MESRRIILRLLQPEDPPSGRTEYGQFRQYSLQSGIRRIGKSPEEPRQMRRPDHSPLPEKNRKIPAEGSRNIENQQIRGIPDFFG